MMGVCGVSAACPLTTRADALRAGGAPRSAAPAVDKHSSGGGMAKINAEWHEANRMPRNATLEQRVRWHLEHLEHCACRKDLPKSVAAEVQRRQAAK